MELKIELNDGKGALVIKDDLDHKQELSAELRMRPDFQSSVAEERVKRTFRFNITRAKLRMASKMFQVEDNTDCPACGRTHEDKKDV